MNRLIAWPPQLVCLSALVLSLCAFAVHAAENASAGDVVRLGAIGLDTSHAPTFARILHRTDHADHVSGARLVAGYKEASGDIPTSIGRVDGYVKELTETYGIRMFDSIEAMRGHVDGVLILSIDGRKHLDQFKRALTLGKPIFIDKPMGGTLREVLEIFRLAREHRIPCFSTSSLRFQRTLVPLRDPKIGDLLSVFSAGPAPYEPHHPDFFWYGIHPVEALYALMGPGCERIVRTQTENTDVLTGVWRDGRIGTVHGNRNGTNQYTLLAYGTKAVALQETRRSYAPLVEEIIKFVRTGISPVTEAETIEVFTFLEAADESKRRGGASVNLDDVLRANGGRVGKK